MLILLPLASCTPRGPYTVDEDGFGPVKIGMRIEEAEKFLSVHLDKDDYNDSEECRYYTPAKGYSGLSFMTSLGKVVRVDVYSSDAPAPPTTIQTANGAKIGDAEARVIELYKGRIKVGPHFYTGSVGGHYLRVYDPQGHVRLIFETFAGKVENFRAGREPAVEYVEGCQ